MPGAVVDGWAPPYTGTVHWNTSEWVKDPDTGKRSRRERPRAEWITHKDEALRIVSDELFARAQRRTRLGGDQRLKSGGKPKYLLSGLLECGVCGAHYIMSDPRSYACSGHIGGHTCTNTIRVRRDQAEAVILGPIRRELLAPERVERMANEIAQLYAEKARARSSRAVRAPQELQDLDARITRLRERLRRGDPDMTADELQAAIDRAEQKRRELLELDEATAQPVKVASVLPRAPALYRKLIAEGLDGDTQAALKARLILRDLLGKIKLAPEPDGSLWAVFSVQPAALLRSAAGAGTDGSGGRI
jgi:site-specific DNA recombinase